MEEKEIFRNYRQADDALQQYAKFRHKLKKGEKFLAFLLVDVVESTAMKEEQDPLVAQHTFGGYNKSIGEILERKGDATPF